ncbi:unnamed protein product, partial [Sphacelaria rigidula]
MSDNGLGNPGRLKRSRDDMIDKPSGVGRSSKSPTSSPQDNKEKSASDILSGRSRRQHQQQQKQPSPRSSGFIPIRPTTTATPPSPPFKPRALSSKSNAIISSSIPISARGGDGNRQVEGMDLIDDGVGSGGELARKPTPTGKFSIRGNAVGVDAGCAGGGLGTRRGGATCVDSANGSFNNGGREERGGVGERVVGARSGGVSSTNGSGASSTFAGNDSISDISPDSSSKNSSSSSPGGEEEDLADSNATRGKTLHAPIATAEALAAGSSGTTGAFKTSGKGKSKSPTPPPPAEPPKSDMVKNGEGGGAGVKHNDPGKGTRSVSSSSPVGANIQKTPVSGKSYSGSSSSSKSVTTAANTTARSRRPSPPPPLTIPDAGDTTVPAAASTSCSSSASSPVSADSHHDNSVKVRGERNNTKNGTSGIIDDSSNSNSSSAKPTKRRRRIARAATPPSGWQAPAAGGGSGEGRQPYPDEVSTSSTSTTNTTAATSAQAKSAALPPTPATAAAGIAAATAAAADPGVFGRRSRRPGSSGGGGPDKAKSTNASPSSLLSSSYGRRAPSPTVAAATAGASTPTRGGDSSSSSTGIKRADGENESGVLPVKKRSRPSVKDEGRSGVAGVATVAVAAGAGATQAGGASTAAAGGKAAPEKPTRGRGRPPGKGKGSASNSTAKARGRRRLLIDGGNPRGPSNKAKDTQRWRTHRMVEDFVNTCGSIMYPQVQVGAFGYQPCEGRFPMERPTTLGILRTELRRPTVVERWSPFQVACFEGAISIHGKV